MNEKTPGKGHLPSVRIFTAVAVVAIGCGLLIAGFIVPPTGCIDSSVLVAFGEILTFGGTLFGVEFARSEKNVKISNNEKDR